MTRTQVCTVAGQIQDGGVEIRAACGADVDALKAFLADLSLRSRYLRFFTGGASASPGVLDALMGSRDNTDALVATQNGTIIGHAMAVDIANPAGAYVVDIGVVVADARQGCGFGSALVREVTARAQARGATTVSMEVLAENRLVLAMIAKRWPDAHHTRSGPYVAVHAQIPTRAGPATPPIRPKTPKRLARTSLSLAGQARSR
jgi:ribosomal protein S18 acetylase RimI-like enzyme